MNNNPLIQALQWHIDQGIDIALDDTPVSFYNSESSDKASQMQHAAEPVSAEPVSQDGQQTTPQSAPPYTAPPLNTTVTTAPISSANSHPEQALAKAIALAKDANSLEELKETILNFDELSIKRTATNIVFADGNKKARVMIVGEAPGADEDRQGLPFVGKSGQLLSHMLKYINLDKASESSDNALYISNIMNWRPPGNRTPDPQEIALSLPFIERHIALINPDFLILAGNTPLKALLHSKNGIIKARGKWQDYTPKTEGIFANTDAAKRKSIPALPILHPAYILHNPITKRDTWKDILSLKKYMNPTESNR